MKNTSIPPKTRITYLGSMLRNHSIKKKVSKNLNGELSKLKKCRLCTGPFTHVSQHCWKQPFRAFHTRFDKPLAWPECAKNVVSHPSKQILSQHAHSHHESGYDGVTVAAQTANIAKMAQSCINSISACPTPPQTL